MDWTREQELFEGRRIDVVEPGGILIRADEFLVEADHEADASDILQRANERRNLERDSGAVTDLGIETRSAGVRSNLVSVLMTNVPRDAGAMVVEVVTELRAVGITAQPNHIFVLDCCCGGGCGPHPSGASSNPFQTHPFQTHPFQTHPFQTHPFQTHPFQTHPFQTHPFQTHPFQTHPFQTHPVVRSSARPAPPPAVVAEKGPVRPKVVVLDTGLPEKGLQGQLGHAPGFMPPQLNDGTRFTGEMVDVPDGELIDGMGAKHAADGMLDPVAGHGAFIAGVIDNVAPGSKVEVRKVSSRMGVVDEVEVATHIEAIADAGSKPAILSLSFGGRTLDQPQRIRDAIRAVRDKGVVVVASAGNSATCVPHFPAALPEVIGVGALGPSGPAPFTNFGPWVNACAPGVDLVSSFFTNFAGTLTAAFGGMDPDDFEGWARWSGTSFSAPYVVGTIVREMCVADVDAETAAWRVVFAPHLPRLTDLGTIVT